MAKSRVHSQNREYGKVLAPTMLGAAGMSVYYITDGLFIGNCLGDDGMSSITIAWVIVTFLTAVATGIGMGGSLQYTVSMGREQPKRAGAYLRATLALLLLASIVMTVVLFAFADQLLTLLGARGNVFTMARAYTTVIQFGVVIQLFGMGLLPVVRNMSGHKVASISMGAGYVLNVLLDYVLMVLFPLGMFGCALAYIAGQFVVMVSCLVFLARRHKRFSKQHTAGADIGHVLLSGTSPFGLIFSQTLMTVFVNHAYLQYGGSEALACYTVVVYVAGIAYTLHRGIMDGSQPLISREFGKCAIGAANGYARRMFICSLFLAVVSGALSYLLRNDLASFFGVSDAVAVNVAFWIVPYVVCFTFITFSRTAVTYFYSMEKSRLAVTLTYAEPALFLVLLMIFPRIWGVHGIWITVFAVYALLALISVIFLLWVGRQRACCTTCAQN